MSSETSTDFRLKRDAPAALPSQRLVPDDSLQPWQLFVLAALACATAVILMTRGRGLAALRAILPLVSREEDGPAMIGHRTRAALEREKFLALRSIKELEFDRAM